MTTAAKKYKLFASTADGGRAPCAFFASPAGCRNGDSCKFSHAGDIESRLHGSEVVSGGVQQSNNHRPNSTVQSPGSVVSSESSSDEVAVTRNDSYPFATAGRESAKSTEPSESPATKKKKKRHNKKASDTSNPFANPKKKAKTSDPIVSKVAPSQGESAKEQAPTESVLTTTNNTKSGLAGFRALNLPVAPFAVAGKSNTPNEQKVTKNSATQESAKSTPQRGADSSQMLYPLPKSTKAGRKWLHLVVRTRLHPRFQSMYDLDKFKKFDEEIGYGSNLWIKPKPFGDWCVDFPQVLALDCEMCETQDPVSGCKDPRALCRISIIDAETGDLLLDSLVKPNWPVVNYRTFVNGITEEHLENVQFTLRHAQAFLLALCSDQTVILGHSVQNDLAAMKMEHYCVVDSACLFEAKDGPEAAVSLKDLAGSVLKKVMPEKHDSVNDASTALACLKYYLEKEGNVDKIERSVSTRPSYGTQLLVHRIPSNCEESHISQMLLLHTSVEPSDVDPISNGKTIAHFRSTQHANLAFDTLEGKSEIEASGRLQKKVYLRSGGYVRVRKMAFEKKSKEDATSSPPGSSTGNPTV